MRLLLNATLIVLNIMVIRRSLGFWYAKFQIFHNMPYLNKEGKENLFKELKKDNKFAYICCIIFNIEIVFMILATIDMKFR
jgi:DMSO/TMAO reductase YedYZ heme-binding membrane subunit